MKDLKIAVCQSDIVWEDAAATIASLEAPVRRYCKKYNPDLLIFPETYSVGFTMNPAVSEKEDGISASWLRRIAAELGVAVIASIPVLEKDKKGVEQRYNRSHFITPSGEEYHYDKRHLFNPSGEGAVYVPGKERCTVSYKGWNIELNICYDLRFPVWSRNVGNRYDLLVNVANWPDVRVEAAKALIRARAIENCSYAVFCNRVGSDTTCRYNGQSAVVDYFGNSIAETRNACGTRFLSAVLSKENLLHFREKFPAWKDADTFTVDK